MNEILKRLPLDLGRKDAYKCHSVWHSETFQIIKAFYRIDQHSPGDILTYYQNTSHSKSQWHFECHPRQQLGRKLALAKSAHATTAYKLHSSRLFHCKKQRNSVSNYGQTCKNWKSSKWVGKECFAFFFGQKPKPHFFPHAFQLKCDPNPSQFMRPKIWPTLYQYFV